MAYYKRRLHADFPIHVTGRSNNREHFPCSIQEVWALTADFLYLFPAGFGVKILSFVLMPNHFHLIVRDPTGNLPAAMAYFMRETSREMGRISNRINKIWGGPYYSSVVNSNLHLMHVYKYVYQNPLRARLCSRVEDYEFSTLSSLLGITRGLISVEVDEMLINDPDETLAWLNQEYSNYERDDLQFGLKKKNFKIRIRPETKKQSPLEHWNSLPNYVHANASNILSCGVTKL